MDNNKYIYINSFNNNVINIIMSDLFEIYQENLKALFSKISSSFDSLATTSNKKAVIDEIEHTLKEIEKLIKDLEVQIATEMTNDPNHSLYVKNYKSGYEQYKRKYFKEKEKVELEIKANTIGLSTTASSINQSIAYNSFDKLERAKRETIEMENVGNDVMRDLEGQKEQMKGITGKVGDIGDQLTVSTGLISDMDRRNKRNKNIIVIFAIALIVIFIGIVLLRIIPKFTSSNPSTGSTEDITVKINNNTTTTSSL